MAVKFFDCKGFGQIEPNQVWFTRDGMIEAQCELDPEDFASHFPMSPAEVEDGKVYGENGVFYMVDKANRLVKIPTTELSNAGFPMGINYSSEKIYNQFTPGRKNFCMVTGEFLPRLGYTDIGMRITTNAVAYDTEATIFSGMTPDDGYRSVWTCVKDALANGTNVYAYVIDGSKGKLVIGASADKALGNVYAQVVKAYTNADGTLAFMFQFINKPTV